MLQVDLSELDGKMVALANLQREFQEALRQRAVKSQELTQVHRHGLLWALCLHQVAVLTCGSFLQQAFATALL